MSTYSATTSKSSQLLQEFLVNFHSRKLLLNSPLSQSPATPPPPAAIPDNNNNFDANVVMVLSVLLCALICSLGLNSIIKCALRCSSLFSSSSDTDASARLANTGVKKKALKTFPTVNYSVDMNLPGLDTECVICLSEFAPGDRVRLLPKCHHGFHVRCIDKWLRSHSSCPTCRHCLIKTCQKIVGCSQQASSSSGPVAPQESMNRSIVPLEPEGLIRDYRNINIS